MNLWEGSIVVHKHMPTSLKFFKRNISYWHILSKEVYEFVPKTAKVTSKNNAIYIIFIREHVFVTM